MRLSRYFKYQYYRMIRLKDTPSKVAHGVGLGFAMDFAVPIPFVSIFVAFLVARILKVNSLAAVMSATALKPFFLAIVALNIYIQDIIVTAVPGLRGVPLPHAPGTTYLEQLINGLLNRGMPYLLAGAINGAVVFVITYIVVYYVLQLRIRKLKDKKAK